MKVEGVRICPACGARNKAAWEFCARCSEPLGELPLATGVAPPRAPEGDATEDVTEETPTSSWAMPLLAVVAAAIAGWAALSSTGPPATEPPPVGLTFSTLPPSAAPISPSPDSPGQAEFLEGRRLMVRGLAAEAAVHFAAAVGADAEKPAYRAALGEALIASGALDDGLAQLEAAARLDPSSADYPREFARALNRAGRTGAAIEAYRQAVGASPDVEAERELADLYMRGGRASEAVPLLRQAADRRPSDLALKQELGHALQRSGDHDGAVQVYEAILAKAPQAHLTRGLLAEVRIAQGRFDEAIAVFQAGVARDASAPLLHRGLASALERAGRDAEAAIEYREYARLAPGAADAEALAARAAALERRAAPTS